ncbi:multidrug and toxin extrusion protein 1 [Eucyclogobius newberryi]|uniref:multidrug and toxin extrusion protein 1 n=1 Tax=Eucyclogobius newberryi TaxID=166745 RepID=UPI003B59D040
MEKLDCVVLAGPTQGARPVAGVPAAPGAEREEEEGLNTVSNKLFRCAKVRHWLPLAYREELYQVLRLTGPLVLSRILNFLLPFVNTIFCGHIGNAELAGYALASAIINVTTSATGWGLGLACDTLISQTFGSKNMKRVGIILQKGSVILMLFCLPCWSILINSYSLLIAMRQEEEVARIAQLYVMIFLPAVPAMFIHQLQVAYLQNQEIIMPQMYTAAVANIFNLGFNYVLIISLDLGVMGSAIASALSHITICLLLFGYIRWRRLHENTWGGWSTDCLQDWGSYMKLAIPSVFMICFEWWVWEIGSFLAGVLGEVDLAAQHILTEIATIIYMFPFGVHAAVSVRVGNALGAGDTTRALVTSKVALVLSGLLAVLQGIVLAGSKSTIGFIFTSDQTIVDIVSKGFTVYIFVQFFDALLCVCSGIFIGAGVQKIAAMSNLVGYYFIGLPVGVALMFFADLRILGLWLGLLICVLLEVGFFLFLIFKLNWKKVTQKARCRAGQKILVTCNRPASAVLTEGNVFDSSDEPMVESEDASKTDGYCLTKTQSQEAKPVYDINSSTNNKNSKTEAALSVSQLILRRGFTLLISVLVLLIGIAFYISFPPPELLKHSRANSTLNWANGTTPAPVVVITHS